MDEHQIVYLVLDASSSDQDHTITGLQLSLFLAPSRDEGDELLIKVIRCAR